MIGGGYWITGITLMPSGGKWAAAAKFFDNGFCEDDSTEGELRTRYYVPDVAQALDLLIADLTRLGIRLRATCNVTPSIYMEGDGESVDVDYPQGWRQVLVKEAIRLGWCTYDWSPPRVEPKP